MTMNMSCYLIKWMRHTPSHILEEMSYDNAVDILNELTKPKVASFLTLMNKDDANEIKHYFTMMRIRPAVL